MKKVLIIAEAGVNHNGDMNKAKALIDAAANAGSDYVKFQSFKADKLVSPDAKKAKYQSENFSEYDNYQYNMLKKLELTHENHLLLMEYAKEKGIQFFSAAFDSDGVDYLDSLGFELFKIPSGELTNYPYLRSIALKKKPVILSTGMANLEEIKKSLSILQKFGLSKKLITLLHCNTEYPSPMKDVNLKAMIQMKNELDVNVGYSDHTLGIEVSIAAVALGACVIEKHFTLDRDLPGPDHKASLEPDELKEMVKSIRNVEEALSGNGKKEPSNSEKKNIKIARKSIYTKREIRKGEYITEKDLIPLRPGDGISPFRWNDVIGKTANKNLKSLYKISWKDLS